MCHTQRQKKSITFASLFLSPTLLLLLMFLFLLVPQHPRANNKNTMYRHLLREAKRASAKDAVIVFTLRAYLYLYIKYRSSFGNSLSFLVY